MRLALAALLLIGVVAPLGQAAAAVQPPVIREPFTPLPCPARPQTTLAQEGCAEKMLVARDRAIDTQVSAIFRLLSSGRDRVALVRSEDAWLRYRRASCSVQASAYAGGSLEPVAYASCAAGRDKTHLADLVAMRTSLAHH